MANTEQLLNTTDARAWARAFIEICQDNKIDPIHGTDSEGFLIGWFANAIETGRMAGRHASIIGA